MPPNGRLRLRTWSNDLGRVELDTLTNAGMKINSGTPCIILLVGLLLTAFSASSITRPTGFGAVPGHRPAALGHGADLAQSSAWRGRWSDLNGYYNIGERLYDPVAGMWLSYDSAWNDRDPNYLTFCGGDPINGFDPDGRLGKGLYNGADSLLYGTANLVNNTLGAIGYLATSPFAPDWANQQYGSYAQGFVNNVTGTAQLGYNVAATASYGLVSPFAPDFAYNNYGNNVQQLMGQAPSFYGGNDQSLAYQIGFGTVNAATMLFGGEVGETGNLGKVGTVADGSVYSVAYQMTLNTADLGKSRSVQFNRANAALDAALQSDATFAAQLEQLIPGVSDSVSSVGGRATPQDWVWHHDEGVGVMQLVPADQHTPGSLFWDTLHPAPGGAGGYSLWAIPAGAPPN